MTPYELCLRYADGHMERAELVEKLTAFPYVRGGETDGYDSLLIDPPGTWAEVSDAHRRGLIDDSIYEDVFNRRHPEEEA